MAKKTWIVVANASLARIFNVESGLNLIEIQTLIHPSSRLHPEDLLAESGGGSLAGAGSSNSGMNIGMSAKETEVILFARQVAECLDKGCACGEFDRLYLAASPSFLGHLRKALNGTLGKIEQEVNKDLTQMLPAKIREYFIA